jgi:anti-sigma factor RsiW
MDNGLSYAVSARTDRPRLLTIAEAIYRQFETAPAQNGGRL